MDLDEIKQILEMVREHELSEFELERDGLKIRIRKDAGSHLVSMSGAAGRGQGAAVPSVTIPSTLTIPESANPDLTASEDFDIADDASIELAVVKSPIVGTFYRASEPTADPFVDVGHAVKKGQILCIIEAMKLMNEIESEYEGEVVKIYVENGQPVQYGERLFAIKTK